MAGLAGLSNVPGTESEFGLWGGTHAAHHRDVNATIKRLFNITLPEYILDPFDVQDNSGFMAQHQDLHNQVNNVLGIPSNYDLTEVDVNDPDAWGGWIFLNFEEHRQWAGSLGTD